ncbi:DUF3488 and transglutaminase-like domain-containing protein [Actinokineospora sp. G85]|uniref:DUF3488 and transglutaminase-like domain-containing protein n=1 Tax=Actinokineospora sp. G85 TaxID=3406626 RepID=UPI003C71F219
MGAAGPVEHESGVKSPVGPPAAALSGVAAVALVVGLLPSGEAFEPRELVRPPVIEVAVANPLPRLAAWAAQGDTELLRVRGPQFPVRMVALADFTGATWRASSLYSPIGAVAPPDLPAGKRTVTAEARVTIGALEGNWLPTMGRPTATSLGDAVIDPDSGSLVLPRGTTPGLTYEAVGEVDRADDEGLATAVVPDSTTAGRYLSLPNLPLTLAQYARDAVKNTTSPYERAVALEQVVRLNRVPDAEAPVGSSYSRVEQFLYGPDGETGVDKGTAEQFATAYAVLARAVGLPTRVVVGFQPVAEDADGVRVLRGVDATAWPEVYFTDWGWVPFDPVSGTDSGPSAAAKREVLNRLASTTANPPPPPTPGPPIVLPTRAPEAAPTPEPDRPWLVPALVVGIPALVLLTLAAARAIRRSRLRHAGAAGAWTHVLDHLHVAGRTPPRHLTAPTIAESLPAPATALATLADRETFAPAPVRTAEDTWSMARQVRSGVSKAVPLRKRLWWPFDPRPLWRKR